MEQSKKEWELAHLMALKEEEERRMEEADEIFYTREDNQVNIFASSSSSSDEDSSDAEVMAVRKPTKNKRKQPAKKQDRKMVRGRGRGSRGLNRADMKRKRAPSSSSEESSVYVDDEKSRDGDPLWREYQQEIAEMESEGFYTDEEQWAFNDNEDLDRYSEEEFDFPETELSSPYRESPLWKVAEQSERLLHEVPSTCQVDYGPNEIMSFSKSGRPRKRNKRLCDDEFEVFSPGSGFSDSVIPRKPQAPQNKPIYSVVIDTASKKATATKKSGKVTAKSQALVQNQMTPQPRVMVPLSLVTTGIPVNPMMPHQSRLHFPLPTVSTVYNNPLQQPSVHKTVFVSQPSQWQGHIQSSRPLLINISSPQIKPKSHDNLFELDFTLDNSNTATNECVSSIAGDELITLNLEPVSLPEESFFEPANEEERNVFESFASLL